jgi:heavy metal translocating P-type ATPase
MKVDRRPSRIVVAKGPRGSRSASRAPTRSHPVIGHDSIFVCFGSTSQGRKTPTKAFVDLRPWSCCAPGGTIEGVERKLSSDRGELLGRYLALGLLLLTGLGLVAGGALHLSGAADAGQIAWAVAGVVGAVYAAASMFETLWRGRLGVDVIALLAIVGALVVGEHLAAAVIAVMVASGRALEGWAAGRSRRDLKELLERAPRTAHRFCGDNLETVELEKVFPGDRLMVGPAELVPVDGMLLSAAVIDESALTGESLPITRDVGEQVQSGVLNAGGPFYFRATTSAADSTYSGIVRLVSEAESSQAPFVRLADRYALWFLLVTAAAAALAWGLGGAPRAVAVLVVATPCPLILAAPVALVSGLSRAARRGVVVKGGGVLERMARCTTLLFDKTGTLTSGHPTLSSVGSSGTFQPDAVLRLAGSLEQLSPHVIANAVVKAALAGGQKLALPENFEEVPGRGARGAVAGQLVAVGNAEWAGVLGSPSWTKSARRMASLDGALTVYVAIDGTPAGVLVFDDPLRPDAARTIRSLRRNGIERIVMVTGDREEVAKTVGAVIGVDEVLAERSPAEKLDVVRSERRHAPTLMVGDGVNDAPALALADVGVAMGVRGATASSEAADAVLSVDRLDRLGEAVAVARRTRTVALQSVVAGMIMSLAAMAVAGVGLLPAVWGAILQEAIDVAVIMNALRALGSSPTEVRLLEEDAALTRRFQNEHLAIRTDIERIRASADSFGRVEPAEAMAEVRQVHRLLVEEVQPHEEAEQEILYPALDRLLGGSDPTGPMSRAHVEIAHQIRRLGQILDDVGPDGPDADDIAEIRRLLYGLHAILKLHTLQEDESYLSLGDDPELAPISTTTERSPTSS